MPCGREWIGVRKLLEALLVCAFVFGIGMLLYPTVSDWWNDMHQSRAVAAYQETVVNASEDERNALWSAAVAYNQRLPRDEGRFTLTDEEKDAYESVLDVSGTGIMGYVEIPKIDVSLPIYHGMDDTILQVAIGHIPGSSLPVGGLGTHCVISGHRGLPSARLFSDIDKLEVGDRFTLHVLDRTLTYEVDQIKTVLPDDLDDLAIEPDKDLCTLVTCTPYGVNTHRLLVRGHRVAEDYAPAPDDEPVQQVDPRSEALAVGAIALAALLVVFGHRAMRRRRSPQGEGRGKTEA